MDAHSEEGNTLDQEPTTQFVRSRSIRNSTRRSKRTGSFAGDKPGHSAVCSGSDNVQPTPDNQSRNILQKVSGQDQINSKSSASQTQNNVKGNTQRNKPKRRSSKRGPKSTYEGADESKFDVLNTDRVTREVKLTAQQDASTTPISEVNGEHFNPMKVVTKLRRNYKTKATQTSILGIVVASDNDLPLAFRPEHQVSAEKWNELQNEHKKIKPPIRRKVSESKDKSDTKREYHNTKKTFDDMENLYEHELISLGEELVNQAKAFWGPLDKLEPLTMKILKLIKIFQKKYKNNSTNELEKAVSLLTNRKPMIESTSVQECDTNSDDSDSNDTTMAYKKITTVGMEALGYYRTLSLVTTKQGDKLQKLQHQFTRCQTNLDAVEIQQGDALSEKASADIHVLCNDALDVLNELLLNYEQKNRVLNIK